MVFSGEKKVASYKVDGKIPKRIKNIIYPSGYVPSTNTVIEFLGMK